MNSSDNSKFSLYYTHDFHSQLPVSVSLFERLYEAKIQEKALIIDGGDFIEGGPFYNFFSGQPEKEILKKIYDYIIPGNHGFGEIRALSKNRKVTIINANIHSAGKPLFSPYKILNKNGYKIGLVGLMGKETFLSIDIFQRQNLEFRDEMITLDHLLPDLRRRVDYLILASHSGLRADEKIARQFPQIDLILSGHCHSAINNITIGKTKIMKSFELGQGLVRLVFHPAACKFSANVIRIKNRQNYFHNKKLKFLNSYLRSYYQVFRNRFFKIDSHFISYNRRKLIGFFAETFRDNFSADLCLLNYPCLRDRIKSEKLSLENIYQLFPFENSLVNFQTRLDKFQNAYQILDPQIKKCFFLCQGKYIRPKQQISLVTTSYLYNNFFYDQYIAESVSPVSFRLKALELLKNHDSYRQKN